MQGLIFTKKAYYSVELPRWMIWIAIQIGWRFVPYPLASLIIPKKEERQ